MLIDIYERILYRTTDAVPLFSFKFPNTAAVPARETSAPRRAECDVAIAKEFVRDRSPIHISITGHDKIDSHLYAYA